MTPAEELMAALDEADHERWWSMEMAGREALIRELIAIPQVFIANNSWQAILARTDTSA